MSVTITKKSLIDFYLEWVNNFLTIRYMAEFYEISEEDCLYLVELGKKLHTEQLENNPTF